MGGSFKSLHVSRSASGYFIRRPTVVVVSKGKRALIRWSVCVYCARKAGVGDGVDGEGEVGGECGSALTIAGHLILLVTCTSRCEGC